MNKLKSVYLAWQDPDSRQWFVVGELQERSDGFAFNYTKGAKFSSKFIPFSGMDELDKTYISSDLFPLFKNRLLSKRRPEYPNFIKWLGLDQKETTPIDILGRSGGLRGTDQLQMFSRVRFEKDGSFEHVFFAHGISHLPESALHRISTLKVKEKLLLCLDCQNQYDEYASIIRADSPAEIIGFCPRYIAKDVSDLLVSNNSNVEVFVEKLSDDAPANYKLMCRLKGKADKDVIYEFMNRDEFHRIVS